MNDSVIYDAPGWDGLIGDQPWLVVLSLLAIGAITMTIAAAVRERRALPRGGGWLIAFRVVAIVACLASLLGLQRRTVEQSESPSRVVVLVDRSASMNLPAALEDAERSRHVTAAAASEAVAARLAAEHDVRVASFDATVAYDAASDAPPAGGTTRLGHAIARTLADYEQAPLAAIVALTDGGWNAGVDPSDSIQRAQQRGVLVHTLGVGPLTEPPIATLRELSAPPRAAVGDPFRASVAIAANAAAIEESPKRRVVIRLDRVDESSDTRAAVFETEVEIDFEPGERLAGAETTINAEAAGVYEVTAELLNAAEPDADNAILRARVELIDEPTRVLLAAGGPTRDYRFLRNQLFRDDAFEVDVVLQSAVGAVTQDAERVLASLPASTEELEPYDVIVAIDFDWRDADEQTTAALGEWVSRRGGGLVFFSGGVNTPACVRAGLPDAVRAVLPVTIKDDPLALGESIAAPRDPRPVRLTPAGAEVGFFDAPGDAVDDPWRQLDGFYAPSLPVDIKPSASALANYGAGVDEAPLCVGGYYGAGRTVYFATPETWRLRRVDSEWFTSLHTGLLRHAAQGRLRGAAAAGSLLFDRQRYDLGESMTLRYVDRSPEAEQRASLSASLTIGDATPVGVELAPVEEQPGVFAVTLRADPAGPYVASVATPFGEPLTAEANVTLPSLEGETVVQNADLLAALAEATGGRYVDVSAASTASDLENALRAAAEATPSVAETEMTLGPPDPAFAQSLARMSLAVMAGALLLEWTLRRAWRLA